jgi:hypothetical protein
VVATVVWLSILPGRQDPVLEVVVAAAFADPGAAQVDRHRAAEHEVDLRQLVERDHPAVLERALDRRRLLDRLLRELLRVEDAEGMGVAQAGDGHDHGLAFVERDPAGVRLRRVGVGLDHPGALPEPVPGQLLGRQLGAGEVRNPSLGTGEAGDALAIHRLPDLLADLILGAHRRKISGQLADRTDGDGKLQGRHTYYPNDPNA